MSATQQARIVALSERHHQRTERMREMANDPANLEHSYSREGAQAAMTEIQAALSVGLQKRELHLKSAQEENATLRQE